jgi:hypothetical protein
MLSKIAASGITADTAMIGDSNSFHGTAIGD